MINLAPRHEKVVYLDNRTMKFQKGILNDLTQPPQPEQRAAEYPAPDVAPQRVVVAKAAAPIPANQQRRSPPKLAEERLFETLEKETGSGRKYLQVFGIVVLLIIVGGIGLFYITLPSVGDKVRGSADLEDAVREHFLTKEKRTATDIVFYKCDGFFGARVGVETRNDLPNPIFKLDTYSAKAVPNGAQWDITAAPLGKNEEYATCR